MQPRGLSLQQKAWVISAGVLLVLALLLALGVDAVFRRGFRRLEQQAVAASVHRLQLAQASEVDALERSCRDYANWDDTYAVVDRPGEAYVEQNLIPSVLANLRVDAFLLFRTDGSLRLGRTFNGSTVTEDGVPDLATRLAAVAQQVAVRPGPGVKGLLLIGNQLAVVAVLPVLHDDGSGPPKGALAQVRLLNPRRVARMREALSLDAVLHGTIDRAADLARESALTPGPGQPFAERAVSDRLLELHVPVTDVQGERVGYWHLRLPREIYLQGVQARLVFYLMLGLLLAAAALLMGWLLRWLVISRLEELHAAVQRVGATSDLSVRLPVRGSDELASLTDGVNRMLAALQRAGEQRAADELTRERLDRQLQEAQKLEAIGTLAGGLAHDFNNLITGIQGSTALIRMESTVAPGMENHLHRIDAAAMQAAGLVRQMMAFGRRAPSVFAHVRLGAVVNDALALVRPSVPRGIEFKYRNEALDDTVYADAAQLQQVLVNLVTNSSHAMAAGSGLLSVEIANVSLPDPERRETIAVRPGEYLRLIVRDTGCGIPPEHLAHVFEPFYTTKPVGAGTGLGLAVVHGIVGAHHGTIGLDTAVGQGTAMIIHLPKACRPENLPAEPLARRAPVPGAPPVRLLLVDDDAIVRDTLEAGLRQMGYDVCALESAAKAVQVFDAKPDAFEAVVTDQLMPGLTGLELGQYFAKRRPELPLILITGYGAAVNEEKVKQVGFAAMLVKPVTIEAVDRTLRRVIAAKRSRTEARPVCDGSGRGPVRT